MIDIYLRDNHEKYSKKEKEEQENFFYNHKKDSEDLNELVLKK